MKTYFVECTVKYRFDEAESKGIEGDESYTYIINALSIRGAKENAVVMAQRDIKNDFLDDEHISYYDILGVDIEDCYETSDDARI
ncbi:MAG: hypothetical protein PHU98_06330 [Mariniphaga sp.]|nr:hypothetical protein [Mariniphaga sp.]